MPISTWTKTRKACVWPGSLLICMNYVLRFTAFGVFKLPTLRMKQLVNSFEIGDMIQYSLRVSRLFGGPHGCLCVHAQIYTGWRNGESQASRTLRSTKTLRASFRSTLSLSIEFDFNIFAWLAAITMYFRDSFAYQDLEWRRS